MSQLAVLWDSSLIQKYNHSGPRYTSYPTALEFSEAYDHQAFYQATQRYPTRSLSLYVHLPFCHQLCYFCACNKVITRQIPRVERYLEYLEREIQQRAPLFAGRQVTQLHWGGGTPTLLQPAQISRLFNGLRQAFHFSESAECSIEIDPRRIDLDLIDFLYQEGFNRISMGVQDFDPQVQRLINREQDPDFIAALIRRAQTKGFCSINLDLIYGLPKQTLASFSKTLRQVIDLAPSRLSIFNYAHLPSRFPGQHKIKTADLPTASEKLAILQFTIECLTAAGYQFIGMDHFAQAEDLLCKAQQAGQLHRNFQGYTTQGDCDLLGLGVSAISQLGDTYAQNQKLLSAYEAQVNQSGHALWRGLVMSADDCLRRDVIQALICHCKLETAVIERHHGISFQEYFATELTLLQPLVADGLLELLPGSIVVTPRGRLLIRNICLCFDLYSRQEARQQQFSLLI